MRETKKAPKLANELVAGKQAQDASSHYFEAIQKSAQGDEPRAKHEKLQEKSRGEAANNDKTMMDSAKLARAIKTLKDADEWTKQHADAWAYMCRACLAEARAGRQMSMQWASELIRRKDFASFRRYGSGINNRLRPVLARRLIKENPECAPFIELRKSIFDELDVEALAHARS